MQLMHSRLCSQVVLVVVTTLKDFTQQYAGQCPSAQVLSYPPFIHVIALYCIDNSVQLRSIKASPLAVGYSSKTINTGK